MIFPRLENTLVIALGHRARHGKDSVCNFILQSNPGARRYAFADALYAYCRVEYGMTTKDAPLLQRVGVQFREERDPLVWIKAAYYKLLDEQPKIAVFTDCRFPNEADFIKQIGGTLVKVERLNADASLYVAGDRDPNHISEIALADYPWDHTIRAQDGHMSRLRKQAEDLVNAVAWQAACPPGIKGVYYNG